jgi:alginate O-acetyltransferase complex protein AlgI
LNFTEFSFWWTVTLIGLPLVLLRALVRKLGLWHPAWDRVSLAVLSLALFYNASPTSLVILAVEIVVNFLALNILQRLPRERRVWLVALVAATDILILGYFKYLEFLVGDLLTLISFGLFQPDLNAVVAGVPPIPPGLSFYTFQMVGMLVDTYRDPSVARVRFVDYVNFATFFPQIVAGPIERRSFLLPQMSRFRLRFIPKWVDDGFRWIVLGMFLKLVLANNLAPFASQQATHHASSVLLSTYVFGLRIYFDFAGYSLIALGIAKTIGIRLTLNFRAPYSALSIREFWHRWHITLSNWFRDYVYLPLGGSRVRYWAANVLIVFTVSGLWHGAGWNFVLWGAYHGILLVLERITPTPDFLKTRRAWGLFRWMRTYLLAMFGWIFFMETDFTQLRQELGVLGTRSAWGSGWQTEALAGYGTVDVVVFALTMLLAHALLLAETASVLRGRDENPYRLLLRTPVVALMLLGIFLLTARQPSQFIYFAF